MTNLTNQFPKTSIEQDLQRMAQNLNEKIKLVLDPQNAKGYYKTLKTIAEEKNIRYRMPYESTEKMEKRIYNMGIMKELFLELRQYQKALDTHSKKNSEILIEFRPNGK